MSLLGKLVGALAPTPSPPVSSASSPCDLFYTVSRKGEETCSACNQPWTSHALLCDFDEVGAEYERQWRIDSGQEAIPLDQEPCDACGDTRAEHERRARANGYADLADLRAELWREAP